MTDRQNYVSSLRLLGERGFRIETVLDVGAAEGYFFVYRVHNRLLEGASHFFIDAMAENEGTYRKVCARFGGGYEIAALSGMEGEIDLRIDPDFYNTHIDYLQPASGYIATRRVKTTTLDNVVRRHGLAGPYLLKIDVQGAELDVLRGALQTLEQAVVVVAEIQIFHERDTLVELLAFMNGNDWALYDLTDLAHYPSDSTLYQCYATFIPKGMDFRRDIPWCLPEQKEQVMTGLRYRRAMVLGAIEELLGGAQERR